MQVLPPETQIMGMDCNVRAQVCGARPVVMTWLGRLNEA